MLLIIDGDSIVWVTSYYASSLGIHQAMGNMMSWLDDTIKILKGDTIVGYLGNEEYGGFRKQIDSEYKKGRKRPDFYISYSYEVRKYLIETRGFKVATPGLEADDEVAIAATAARRQDIPHIICGNDKDLLQIEGTHYNIDKKTMSYIDKEEAEIKLCMQMLAGDSTDNVTGIPGIGPKTAMKILRGDMQTKFQESPVHRSLDAYITKFGINEGLEKFCKNTLLVLLKTS